MKLCDITQAYTPTSGGIRTYITEKRRYLERATEHEHVLIVPGGYDGCTHEGRLTVHTVSSPFIPGCEPYRIVLALDKVTSILERERPDLIELGSAYTLPWAVFRHQRDCGGCAVTGFHHTDFPTAYVETAVRSLLGRTSANAAKFVAGRYIRTVYNRFDLTVSPSLILRNRLRGYGVHAVEHVPLGVDTRLYAPWKRNPSIRARFGFGDGDFVLVYSGRLDSEKRIDVILDAFKRLPGDMRARLLLIGGGPLADSMEKAAARDPRIVFLPYMSDKEDLAGCLASADCYVTAGPFETFGLSVLEAQASGLPAVGVRAGALVERIDETVGTLCEPGSPAAMARAIEYIFDGDCREKGSAARKMAVERYSWECTFEKLMEHYGRVTATLNTGRAAGEDDREPSLAR